MDGDHVYITDELNAVVRVLDTTTGIQNPLIGLGSMGFAGDGGPAAKAQIDIEPGARVAVHRVLITDDNDEQGDDPGGTREKVVVYLADAGNRRIRKIEDGIVTTVAGNGQRGYSGDGGLATQASFNEPTGVAVDAVGNVYVADWRAHVVRKIDTSGIVTTVAGTGTAGFSGDGGSAQAARLNTPVDLVVGADGSVFVAEFGNHRIRRIHPSGTISTVAGGGSGTFTPVSVGDGGPATEAKLQGPSGVELDGLGNIFIADTYNNRIRRVGVDGIIKTIAGTGVQGFSGDGGPARRAQLSWPTGVAPDDDGNVYIADLGNKRVRRVGPGGVIATVSGNGTTGRSGDGGSAVDAQINGTFQADVDATGNVFIADIGNDVIRKIDTRGIVTTFAGNAVRGYGGDFGPAADASLNLPFGVAAAPDGSVYIADTFNHRLRKVAPDGTITTVAGNGVAGFAGDGGPAVAGQFAGIVGIDVDAQGNVFIADSGNNRIRLITPNGFLWTIAGTGFTEYNGEGRQALSTNLDRPVDVDASQHGLFIVEQGGQRVRRVDLDLATFFGTATTVAGRGPHVEGTDCFDPRLAPRDLEPLNDGGPATAAHLSCPTGVAVDAAGVVFIADFYANRIRRVGADGIITSAVGTTMGLAGDGGLATSSKIYGPTDVAVNPIGDLLVVDHGNNRVRRVAFDDASRRTLHASWPIW